MNLYFDNLFDDSPICLISLLRMYINNLIEDVPRIIEEGHCKTIKYINYLESNISYLITEIKRLREELENSERAIEVLDELNCKLVDENLELIEKIHELNK